MNDINDDAIDKIMSLKPKSYDFCRDKDTNKRFGFIAQDVLNSNIPELVIDNQTEFIKILRFLEVSEKFIPEFKKYNTSSKPKSFLIARLLNLEIIRLIGETVHRLIPGTNNYDPFSWNSQPFERTEMPDDLRSLLEEELKDTRIKFQSLLQKD